MAKGYAAWLIDASLIRMDASKQGRACHTCWTVYNT